MDNVNKKLLPMKAHYFLFNAGLAGILSFLPLYARQLGFSGIVVGTIYTVLPITGILAKPLLGAVADRFQLQKVVFLGCLVTMAFSFFATQFVPEVPSNSVAVMTCDPITFFEVCRKDLDTCSASHITDIENNASIQCETTCHAPPNSTLWPQICSYWHVDHYCNSTKTEFKFVAEVSLKHTLQLDSCIFFRIRKARIAGKEHVPYCGNFTSANCSVSCTSIAVNQLLEVPVEVRAGELYQFWLFLILLVVAFITKAVATSVGDAICFQLLGSAPQDFGRQRLWGAVGWGIASMLSGVLVDEFSKGKVEKDYSAMFYLMLILVILDVGVTYKLEYSKEILPHNIMKDVGKLMLEPRIMVFLLWCTFVGITTGILWIFLFWHLEDLVSADDCNVKLWLKTLEGLIVGVRCFGGELPFFFFAGHILKKLGHIHSMSLVLFVFGLRCTLYAVLRDPWWCLPLELLQGLTFGICYTAMTSYASVVAPPGTEATMQGIVGAIFEGVGVSLGSLLGGVLYDAYGGAATFRAIGVASFIVFIVHVFVQHLLSYSSRYRITSTDYSSPQEALTKLEEIQEYDLSKPGS